MKKSLILVIQILTEITLLLSSAIVIYVLFTGDGVFTIGSIVVSSHGFIRPLVILIVACMLRKIGTGYFWRGFFTMTLLQWGWTQIRRFTEHWAGSSQFRRHVLRGLVVFILLAISIHWLRSAVTIERGQNGRYMLILNLKGNRKSLPWMLDRICSALGRYGKSCIALSGLALCTSLFRENMSF